MNYYDSLIDISFFSKDEYDLKIGNNKIKIRNPGLPMWKTWRSKEICTENAIDIWEKLKNENEFEKNVELLKMKINLSDLLIFIVMVCDEAYRNENRKLFFNSIRFIYSYGDKNIKFRTKKILLAWLLLESCGLELNSIERIKNKTINYLNSNCKKRSMYKNEDIKVELPIKKDWIKNQISHLDKKSVINFYKTANAYILELIAANYQVETLFNYSIILSMLKELGVSKIFDYGAGIGTFVIASILEGFDCIYSDIASKTMRYAIERVKNIKEIEFVMLDPNEFIIPKGVECVVCLEVLEHIFEPEKLIDSIYNSLPQNGVLVVSESFNYVDNFCSHLPQHKGKGDQIFLKYLRTKGFQKIETGYNIHPTIHIKK